MSRLIVSRGWTRTICCGCSCGCSFVFFIPFPLGFSHDFNVSPQVVECRRDLFLPNGKLLSNNFPAILNSFVKMQFGNLPVDVISRCKLGREVVRIGTVQVVAVHLRWWARQNMDASGQRCRIYANLLQLATFILGSHRFGLTGKFWEYSEVFCSHPSINPLRAKLIWRITLFIHSKSVLSCITTVNKRMRYGPKSINIAFSSSLWLWRYILYFAADNSASRYSSNWSRMNSSLPA